MRIVGLILVIVGALGLAYEAFSYAALEPNAADYPWLTPITAGIALTSGLVLLLVGGRREEA